MFQLILPDFNETLALVNNFLEISFGYLKYIFAGILIIIGTLTLLSLRGRYFLERLRYSKEEKLKDNPLTKPRIIVGTLYIIFGLGIIWNWFIYLLIFFLDILPDRFIFIFIQFTGLVDKFALNRISDINLVVNEFEKTIYYGMAIVSFIALLSIILSARQLILGSDKSLKKAVFALIGGILMGLIVGYTTCLPLFL